MTRPSGPQLAREALGLISGKPGTKASSDRPRAVAGVLTFIDDHDGSLLLKSPQLIYHFGSFLEQAPEIEYSHNGKYIKKITIRRKDGHDYIYTFKNPKRKPKDVKQEQSEMFEKYKGSKVRTLTQRLTHPTAEEKPRIVQELLRKQLIQTPEHELPLEDIATKRKLEAKYQKAAEDYEARIANPTEWAKIVKKAQFGKAAPPKYKPTSFFADAMNDIYDEPVYAEPRTRSGLPSLPTPGEYQYPNPIYPATPQYILDRPDVAKPRGRPKKYKWQPYPADKFYDEFGELQPYIEGGAEESKSDSDDEL
ncbi:hypothetical protein [Crucivirus-409]|nr:hypothetical protein [Crucivirus-409]QMW68878.1 hypothetical protein [Crucivirus-410]